MFFRPIAAFAAALLLSCPFLAAQSATPSAQTPIVVTANGSLSGVISPRTLVSAFKGIPFGAPPVGDLRWRPPQPVQSWQGVRDGSHFGDACMQKPIGHLLPWTDEFLERGHISEDCLYLNVWTPEPHTGAHLPVVVYIPGGGFNQGSGDVAIYNGEALASTGLVVITVNYRLNAFGFLAHPALTAESPHRSSGNYALLDQIAALRWVQRNIGSFGGDPSRVLLWGQSAGAASVGDLLASPEAKGLFQRAMADSGLSVSGNPPPTLAAAEQAGTAFAERHHAATLQQLRALPAADLLDDSANPPAHFAPILDGWVLPSDPHALNRTGGDIDVPVITGYQANDGILFSQPIHTVQEFHERAQKLYGPQAAEFERLYPASTPEQLQMAVTESTRDRDRVAMFLWAQQRSASHKSPVYTYFWTRAIPWPQHPEYGAFHSGELPYLFRNLALMDRPWEPTDLQVARIGSTYLKNFAETGDPNQPDLPRWPATDPNAPSTLAIGGQVLPEQLASPARQQFWIKLLSASDPGN